MWFKVDDHFAMHPKAVAAGNRAIGLWVRAGSWSADQLTDGFVPAQMISPLGGTRADARQLVAAGLWLAVDGGWKFHDWGDTNPTAKEVTDRRTKRAEAGRKGGRRPSKQQANAKQVLATCLPDACDTDQAKRNPVPVPVPVPESVVASVGGSCGDFSRSRETETCARGPSATDSPPADGPDLDLVMNQ